MDAASARRTAFEGFLQSLLDNNGTATYRAQLQLGATTVNVDIESTPQVNTIRVLRENPPGAIERSMAEANLLQEGSSVRFTLEGHHPRFAHIGDLRSAYLLAFTRFGYRWILNHSYEHVRRQILDPRAEILDGFIVDLRPTRAEARDFVIVSSPASCLLVRLGTRGVMLPLPGEPDPYGEMKRHTGLKSWSGRPLAWPTLLVLEMDFAQR